MLSRLVIVLIYLIQIQLVDGLVPNLCLILVTLWTIDCHAPLSMGFPKQEYWTGLPFPSPGIFSTQGLNQDLLQCRQILYQLRHQGSSDMEDALEKEMATHSSILAWEIPWTEEHGGL